MRRLSMSLCTLCVVGLTACGGGDGEVGEAGVNGLNSLVGTTALSMGDAQCMGGGLRIDVGLDRNVNDKLDADEITDSHYDCQPHLATDIQGNTASNRWYKAAKIRVEKPTSYEVKAGAAKNVILFVGDGMGVSTVTAARILEGQLKGMLGEENVLSFGEFPFAGLAKTYNIDAQTPDSAGTMTAMMTGVKTDAGVIGVDEDVIRSDCSTVTGNELVTVLELAEIVGKSTGIVSTARITHATPAATYAKSPERNWEDNADMSTDDIDAGCEDVASQLIHFEGNLEARMPGIDVDGIDVAMGGGRRSFLPNNAEANSPDAVSVIEGDRTDGRNLITEWTDAYHEGVYVFDQAGFDAIDTETTTRVLGLFNESHMQYAADRMNDVAGEPSISEMTEKAIGVLNNNENGYFLMVESGRIDHAHHAGNAHGALADTIEFAKAVKKAVMMTNNDDTLIIVTADHGHVFTIAGYPKRGNPILGKVVGVGLEKLLMAADGMPYTTLGYTNGPGFQNLREETDSDAVYDLPINAGRKDLLWIETKAPGYYQEALVPLKSESHSGEDVGIYATGPGAALITGTNEQNIIFHVINYAAGLVTAADAAMP